MSFFGQKSQSFQKCHIFPQKFASQNFRWREGSFKQKFQGKRGYFNPQPQKLMYDHQLLLLLEKIDLPHG
jgi:hypothetical protein